MNLPTDVINEIIDYLHPINLVRLGLTSKSLANPIILNFRKDFEAYKDYPIKVVFEHAILNKKYNWIIWAGTEIVDYLDKIRVEHPRGRKLYRGGIKIRACVVRKFMKESNYKIMAILMSLGNMIYYEKFRLILLCQAACSSDPYFLTLLTNNNYGSLTTKELDKMLYTNALALV